MPALVGQNFAHSFLFARTVAADYRRRTGAITTAAINEPRFDHDSSGQRLGLLVTRGAARGQHDDVRTPPGDWVVAGRATVLCEWSDAQGIHRRAAYTRDARAALDGFLRIAGHHRMIGAVASYLPNLGGALGSGYVHYANRDWPLGDALGAGDGFALGDDHGRIIIESA